MPSIGEQTRSRLEGYKLFSEQTITTVVGCAQKQAGYEHYQDFFDEVGVGVPSMHYYTKRRGVHVIDVPARSTPEKGVIAMHLPMGNPLDTNQRYQLATLAATNPAYRIVAFGNPCGKPYRFRQQARSLRNYFRIAFGNNKEALVAGELDYLASKNYQNIHHIGYSFGAHKALVASLYAPKNSIRSITVVDPVAHSRYARQLLGDFQRTFKPMGAYVDRTGIPSYLEARRATASVNYNAGLARPINLAIGFMLARLDFIPLLRRSIAQQPEANYTVAWGSESELGNAAHLQANLHNLAAEHSTLRSLRLEGDKHTLANDIHLHAAIIREGLTRQAVQLTGRSL